MFPAERSEGKAIVSILTHLILEQGRGHQLQPGTERVIVAKHGTIDSLRLRGWDRRRKRGCRRNLPSLH